jgi:hypothetical protein
VPPACSWRGKGARGRAADLGRDVAETPGFQAEKRQISTDRRCAYPAENGAESAPDQEARSEVAAPGARRCRDFVLEPTERDLEHRPGCRPERRHATHGLDLAQRVAHRDSRQIVGAERVDPRQDSSELFRQHRPRVGVGRVAHEALRQALAFDALHDETIGRPSPPEASGRRKTGVGQRAKERELVTAIEAVRDADQRPEISRPVLGKSRRRISV